MHAAAQQRAGAGSETFETRLYETLMTELRRQGLINSDEIVRGIMAGLRRSGITSMHINASNLQLNDRACVAVIETLLKLTNHPAAPPEWIVSFSNNAAITDRVSGHMLLLVQRCTKLVSLDVTNAENLSSAAIAKIEAACKVGANSRLELFSGSSRVARADSIKPLGRNASSTVLPDPPSLSGTATPLGAAAVRADADHPPLVDVAALKRRRDSMLKEESTGVGARPPQPHVNPAGRTHSRTPSKGSPLSRHSRARSEPRNEKDKGAKAATTPRTPSASKALDPKMPPAQTFIADKAIGSKSRSSPTTRPSTAPAAPSTVGEQKPRSKSPQAPVTSVTAAAKTTTAATSKAASRAKTLRSASKDDDDRASVCSDATTATEVPDHQDFLDITANMNPMIDHVVSLEHQGVSHDILMRRLKQALVAPPGSFSFASVTVLNLSSNQLSFVDGALFPSTLLRVDLSDNQLVSIPSFAACSMLAVANLRRNRIQKIGSAFEHNLNIGHLFLGRNELSFVDGIGHLWVLETLDLSCNRISSQVQLRPLSLNSALRHIVLKGNPLEKKLKTYRATLRNLVPSLIAVDNERLAFSRKAEACMNQDHQMSHDAVARGSSPRPPVVKHDTAGGVVGSYAVRNMLSKGLSGLASVYSEKGAINASRKRIAGIEKKKAVAAQQMSSHKILSRREVVTKLCQQSKRFLEETIVERLTAAERRRELEGLGEPIQDEASQNASLDGQSDVGYAAQVKRSEPVHVATTSQGRNHSPSPAPERPNVDSPQGVLDKLISGHALDGPPRAPTPKHSSQPGASHLTYRQTASSRARSRSGSNRSSRSPSPNIGDGKNVLSIAANEPLSTARKEVKSPMATAVRAASPTLARANSAAKEPANYITPSRLLGRRKGPITSPALNNYNPGHVDSDEEIVLSPEGASVLFPQGRSGKQVSPIRNALEMTDLSADGTNMANAMVPRMDPGPSASPVPRSMRPAVVETPIAHRQPPRRTLVSPGADDQRLSSRANASGPPLPRAAPSPNVVAWTTQFKHDLGAVQMSLRTVVDLVWSSLHAPDADTAERLAEERARCISIVTKSKMLDDTEVPIAVVRYYGFRPDELNDPQVARVSAGVEGERGDVLEGIHEMGSSKTCLRYLVALVDTGRDDLLRRYVEGIKQEMDF